MTRFNPTKCGSEEASSKPSTICAKTAASRQAAQHLVKVADGDVAAGFGVGRTAFQFGAGAGVVFRQSLAGRGGDFLQAAGEKFLAHFGEVVFPVQLHAELRGSAAIGGVHEFDILHVFAGGAVDHGGDGFGDMVVRGQSELVEGGEEMVVAGLVAGAPVAHGPCVDDLVVEDVVVIGAADAGLRRVMFAGIAGGAQQAGRGAVDAEIVGCREVEQILGVNRAIEVVVQVAALGDVVQESQQQGGLVADRVEIARRLLLSGLSCCERGEKRRESDTGECRLQARKRTPENSGL